MGKNESQHIVYLQRKIFSTTIVALANYQQSFHISKVKVIF